MASSLSPSTYGTAVTLTATLPKAGNGLFPTGNIEAANIRAAGYLAAAKAAYPTATAVKFQYLTAANGIYFLLFI